MPIDETQLAHNPPGYIDEFGDKHTWSMYEGWVEHRVNGTIHSTQALQGFLDYGVPSIIRHEAAKVPDQPDELAITEAVDSCIDRVLSWDSSVKGYIPKSAVLTILSRRFFPLTSRERERESRHLAVLKNVVRFADGRCWPEVQAAIDANRSIIEEQGRRGSDV